MELLEQTLTPVLAAMSAMDDAIVTHRLFEERLNGAIEEATRLDEALRKIDPAQEQELYQAAQKLAFAVTLVQRIAFREERARLEMRRAQEALEQARRLGHKAHLEHLRVELTIDAASIWDLVGQFELQLRERLQKHAEIAQDMQFAAAAAGEPELPALESAALTPALGASGPDLFRALASGVPARPAPLPLPKIAPVISEPPVSEQPITEPPAPILRHAAVQPLSPQPPASGPPSAPPTPRGRLERALRSLGRVINGDD
jgi:hypothetical protein